jgi:TPR repeat protein
MYNLGVLLANQWDPPELDQARTWWEKAADAETTSAMYKLSLLQANRWDPPQLDQARTWYEKAADGGNTNAMYNLGLLVTNQWDPPQGGPGPHLVRKRPQRRATARHFSSWRHRAYCCDATH